MDILIQWISQKDDIRPTLVVTHDLTSSQSIKILPKDGYVLKE